MTNESVSSSDKVDFDMYYVLIKNEFVLICIMFI